MNNATKRALFNARRRYNNARTRANGVPNSDPEAKGRALNNVMNAAANYLTAVKGASAVMPPRDEQRLTRRRLPPIPGRRPASVNVLMPPPLPSVPAPQANIRNRMRAAIMRHYGVANVPNANVDAFLVGHMEYNDPEISALYNEYQASQGRRGGRRMRQSRRGRRKQRGGNGNNNYNTEAYSINVDPKAVRANQNFIEHYNEKLAAKQQAYRNLGKRYRALKDSLRNMIPGSQEYMEAHEEFDHLDKQMREMMYNTMSYMPMMRNTLKRNLSYANRPPTLEVSFAGHPITGDTLSQANTLAPPAIRATGVRDGLYTITIWDADAAAPGYLHMMVANLSPAAGVLSLPARAIYHPPTPPSGVHRYFVTLWKQLRPAVKEYHPGPFAKDTLFETSRPVAETFFKVAATP